MQAEIIVVDNASVDNSLEYLQPRFPGIHFIASHENLGFAKACNQGLRHSTGRYILFLNPDTIVPEDCFQQCITFFESHPDAGALGVKMLDGSGNFLKESKRAFPSPLTSLYKLFGLAKLFPRSATFAKYHLGHLDAGQTNKADVLAGAFMMVKKEVLDKAGSFDETFFMYGEDIDLSYRIRKAGYENYYFAGTSIIHFKGESTRKGSMNYVRMFYKAMSTFVKKHYGGSKAGVFNFLIQVAIWFRAILSAAGTFIRKIGLPLLDAGLILLSFWLVKTVWSEYVRTDTEYKNSLLWIAFPAYTAFYLVAAYYAGLYDRWYKRSELVSSTVIATIVLLAAYALLPEQYRFSRAILLFGSVLAFLLISLLRWILIKTEVVTGNKETDATGATIIAGSPEEYTQIIGLLNAAGEQQRVLGRVAVNKDDTNAIGYYGDMARLSSVVPFREIILCVGKLSYAEAIKTIQQLPGKTTAKIHATGSTSIIGSSSKDAAGEALSKENGLQLSNPYNRRLKRLIDVSVAVFALLTFPLQLFIVKKPFRFFTNCFAVLFAQKTWIGYTTGEKNLPRLKPPVIACNGVPASVQQSLPAESLQMMDFWYARDYQPLTEIKMIGKLYRKLGG